MIGLFQTEPIKSRGPWRTAGQVELATLEYIGWFNNQRLYEASGDIPRPQNSRTPTTVKNAALTKACQTTT